jgi:hypothetical protein
MGAIDHDSNGTTDYGLWQINSVHGYNPQELLDNAMYNAKAAVAVFKSQGLGAWTTYTSGAYTAYLGSAGSATVKQGITRPGGSTGESSVDALLAAWSAPEPRSDPEAQTIGFNILAPFNWAINEFNNVIGPTNLAAQSSIAISDAIDAPVDALKMMAFLFNPKNWLRAVEFLAGIGLMSLGVHASISAYQDSKGKTSGGLFGPLAGAFKRTPTGRATTARRAGRDEAKRSQRNADYQRNFKAGKKKQSSKQVMSARRKVARSERAKSLIGQAESLPY